jgi:hypothetical protein
MSQTHGGFPLRAGLPGGAVTRSDRTERTGSLARAARRLLEARREEADAVIAMAGRETAVLGPAAQAYARAMHSRFDAVEELVALLRVSHRRGVVVDGFLLIDASSDHDTDDHGPLRLRVDLIPLDDVEGIATPPPPASREVQEHLGGQDAGGRLVQD